MNIETYLEDVATGVMRMMQATRQENQTITFKDKEGNLKSFMALFYFDDPEYNKRVYDAMVAEALLIDEERDGKEKEE
jgi:uncharacterized protein YrzB (UPF0473 family)